MPLPLIALIKAAVPVISGVIGASMLDKKTVGSRRPGVPGGTQGVPPPENLPPSGGLIRRDRPYISWVQASLNAVDRAGLTVDGQSGTRTRAAVSAFQGRNRLDVDGLVGQQTQAALIAALRAAGAANPTPPPMP